MTNINEVGPDPNQLAGALADGRAALLEGEFEFQVYTRVVLPLDGFVFWSPGGAPHIEVIKGLLHYAQQVVQNEDETFGQATAHFTTAAALTTFADNPNQRLFVVDLADGSRVAFNSQQGRFDPSGQWHYVGHSVTPAFASQLLDHEGTIDVSQSVLTNSVPLWLGLNGYSTSLYDEFRNDGTPFVVKPPILFPSHIVDSNETPPYGSVFVPENGTIALQAAPHLDANRNHHQLMQDTVRITLYGLQRNTAMDFVDVVNQYSVATGNFGIMNQSALRDSVRTQSELEARAMKKTIEYEISYDQYRVAEVSRQLIRSALPTWIVS